MKISLSELKKIVKDTIIENYTGEKMFEIQLNEGEFEQDNLRRELLTIDSMLDPGLPFVIKTIDDNYGYAIIEVSGDVYKVISTEDGLLVDEINPSDDDESFKPFPIGNAEDIADEINKRYSLMAHMNESESVSKIDKVEVEWNDKTTPKIVSISDILVNDKGRILRGKELDRPKDSEGEPITLNARVELKKDNNISGRVKRIISNSLDENSGSIIDIDDLVNILTSNEFSDKSQDSVYELAKKTLSGRDKEEKSKFYSLLAIKIDNFTKKYPQAQSLASEFRYIANRALNEEILEDAKENNSERYMFFSNLDQIRSQARKILELNQEEVEGILSNGHDWAQDHVATSKESLDQVFDFLMGQIKQSETTEDENIEESNVRSHANGRGQNKKPQNFPKQLKRNAMKEGFDYSREEIDYNNKKSFEEEMDKEVFYVVDNDFNKKNYPELIGKTFENPPSYAQVKVVKQKDIDFGEDELKEGDGLSFTNREGENSKPQNLKESYGDRYEEVVFFQGHEADHALNILMEDGKDEAMEYLKQWHYPGEHDGSEELGHGKLDKNYEKDGYIMSWNSAIGYIGLVYDTEHDKNIEEDSHTLRNRVDQREKNTPLGQHSPHSQKAKK